jgi:hypothetical protein
MEGTAESIEVRSYRGVFELERRIYRVDRVRLNPAGVPIRGLVYCGVLAVAILIAQGLPVAGPVVRELPWYLRYGGLAAALAALLTILRIDGRAFHVAALGLWRLLVGPRQLWRLAAARPLGARWRPPPVVFVPDGSQAGAARLCYRGPGAVLVLTRHRCRARSGGRRLLLEAAAGGHAGASAVRPRVVALGGQTTVEVAGHGEEACH